MFKKSEILINKFKSLYPLLIIFLVITAIYLVNYPYSKYIMGGDCYPFLYFDDYILRESYVWMDSMGFGGVGTGAMFYGYLPIIFLIRLLKLLNSSLLAQYLFNYIQFISIPLSFYFFTKIFNLKVKERLLFTFYYSLSLIVALAIRRNVIFINLIYSTTPLITYFIYYYLKTQKIKYLIGLVITGIINATVASNPAYFAIQMLFLTIFVLWLYFSNQLKFDLRSLLKVFLALYCFTTSVLFSHLIFYKYNDAIVTDSWNYDVLLKSSLEKQRLELGLAKSLTGVSTEVFDTWGYLDGDLYYPFEAYFFFEKNIFILVSFFVLILIVLNYYKASRSGAEKDFPKNLAYWVFVFLLIIFISKSSSAPFGRIFEHLVTSVPIFGIFRNPHQKFGLLYLLISCVLLILLYKYIDSRREAKIFKLLLIVYVILFSVPFLSGKSIGRTYLVDDIPQSYDKMANYIKNNKTINRIVLLPYNGSTWISTDYGFEGYPIFLYLLPEKQISNRNSTAYSSYNDIFSEIFSKIEESDPNLVEILGYYNIDTLLFDGYVDGEERFNSDYGKERTFNYLNSLAGLKLDIKFDRIYLYRVDKSYLKPPVVAGKSDVVKVNPSKYILKLRNVSGQREIKLLSSYHEGWDLYLDKIESSVIKSVNSEAGFYDTDVTYSEESPKMFAFNEILHLWQKKPLEYSQKLYRGYSNSWDLDFESVINNLSEDSYIKNSDGSVDIKMVLYFTPQSYYYIGLLVTCVLTFIILIYCVVRFCVEYLLR